MASWQLTSANFIEHYGLLREKRPNGRYERCQLHHSWNANHLASNLVLFHLERHSDHHTYATRRYQSLRHFDHVPVSLRPAALVPGHESKSAEPGGRRSLPRQRGPSVVKKEGQGTATAHESRARTAIGTSQCSKLLEFQKAFRIVLQQVGDLIVDIGIIEHLAFYRPILFADISIETCRVSQ